MVALWRLASFHCFALVRVVAAQVGRSAHLEVIQERMDQLRRLKTRPSCKDMSF